MKKYYKTLSLAAGMLCLFSTSPVAAADSSEMENIRRQLEYLITQNQQLTRRIVELESNGPRTAVANPAPADNSSGAPSLSEKVSFSALIEGEFSYGNDYDGNTSSEFVLATVELGLEAELNDWARAAILALYEGGEENEDLLVDEGFLEIGNFDRFPLSIQVGKLYVPFGNFETHMVQDPLTLEIGEISDFAVNIAFESAGLYGGFFSYNGMKDDGGSDVIKGYGAQFGYAIAHDSISIDTAISYVSNIADSGGISDFINDTIGKDTVYDQVAGLGIHAITAFGPTMLITEYVTALDNFNETGESDPELHYTSQPAAWNIEFSYSADVGSIPGTVSVGLQGSNGAGDLGLPESRYIAAVSLELFPATALTLEYFFDTDYDTKDGGTDETSSTFTTQLAYEF